MQPISLVAGQRLIAAADYDSARPVKEVLSLARSLRDLELIMKLESVFYAPGGRILIRKIKDLFGLRVFLDLKIKGNPLTLSRIGSYLKALNPDFLTVDPQSGVPALRALKEQLPNTELLGLTVLTSLDDSDTKDLYAGATVKEMVTRFALIAQKGGLDGLIASPHEVRRLRAKFGALFSLNTPDIRLVGQAVSGDDQNPKRCMSPGRAIVAGADRIVVGRPIIRAADPRAVAESIIEEISQAMSSLLSPRNRLEPLNRHCYPKRTYTASKKK